MKEHPILFTTEMVRAIIEGRKTQTRRVVKPQPIHIEWFTHQNGWCAKVAENRYEMKECPYGVPGDRLWVRETWCPCRVFTIYRADCIDDKPSENTDEWNEPRGDKWRPSIHMPRTESRILLEVTNVRVERVQEISEADIIAEGCPKAYLLGRNWYQPLWDTINAKRGYPWKSNPWAWVVLFKLLEVKGRVAA